MKEQWQKGIKVAAVKELPFVIFEAPNGLSTTMHKCFEEANFTPHVYLATRYAHLTPQICSSALAACVMSQITILNEQVRLAKDINIFPLLFQGKKISHKMCLLRHKKRYIPTYMHYFIKLLKDHFATVSDMDLTRIV